MMDCMVSVIVPVYNVYDYIDECMQSIVDQSFEKFEIILINDGSTDGSDMKCLKWQDRDKRVRYISKDNEGLALTRNIGIKNARGEYLVFIDSDDWIDKTYLEKMYNAIEENNADLVECDYWRYDNNTGEKTYRACYGSMNIAYTLEEHMIYGQTMAWKYMSKKSIWVENNLTFPNCLSASHAIYALLLVLSKKVVNIREPLYYYRRFRKGSILDTSSKEIKKECVIGLQALQHMIDVFKDVMLYEKYMQCIEHIVTYSLSDYLAAQYTRMSPVVYSDLCDLYYQFVRENFPQIANEKYIVIGGYNLNKILACLNMIQDPYCRFNFSSIISLMSDCVNIPEVEHKNKYRKEMINRDIKGTVWQIIERKKPKYIFIDFIEERFDVIWTGQGYITKSDALDDAEIDINNWEVLKRNTDQCRSLWEKSWSLFVERLSRYIHEENIIVIKNYLSEYVGDDKKKRLHDDILKIRSINEIIKGYYEFVSDHYPKIKMIEVHRLDMYFTDEKYEYGAIPSHLNGIVNRKISLEIRKML